MAKSLPDVVNDFEAWAEVSAQLHGRSDDQCERLLAELGIREVWNNADAAWSKAIADEMSAMMLDRVQRYGVIVARQLERRRVGGQTSAPDFRHTATFGTPTGSSPGGNAKQVGGTPFGDPDERAPTKKMQARDVKAALAKATDAATDGADGSDGALAPTEVLVQKPELGQSNTQASAVDGEPDDDPARALFEQMVKKKS